MRVSAMPARLSVFLLLGLMALAGGIVGTGESLMASDAVRLYRAGELEFHYPPSVRVKRVETRNAAGEAAASILVEFDEDSFAAVEIWQAVPDARPLAEARATAIFSQIRQAFASRPEFPFTRMGLQTVEDTAENCLVSRLEYRIAEFPYFVESRVYRTGTGLRVFTLNAPKPPTGTVLDWCRRIRREITPSSPQ